jgi:hypothetical protein
MTMTATSVPRGIALAACAWTVLFAAPHTWWALGITAGFPGGEDGYNQFMSSTWRYMYDVIVVLLSVTGMLVVVALARAPEQTPRRWLPHSLAWFACGLLSLRGVAGLVVDGTADLIWWPTFLLGGVLYGLVAWFARLPHGGSARAA